MAVNGTEVHPSWPCSIPILILQRVFQPYSTDYLQFGFEFVDYNTVFSTNQTYLLSWVINDHQVALDLCFWLWAFKKRLVSNLVSNSIACFCIFNQNILKHIHLFYFKSGKFKTENLKISRIWRSVIFVGTLEYFAKILASNFSCFGNWKLTWDQRSIRFCYER